MIRSEPDYGFYTNVSVYGNKVLCRGRSLTGQRFTERADFCPTMFVPSATETKHKTLDGQFVAPISTNIKDLRDLSKQYQGSEATTLYGNNNFVCQYIGTLHPDGDVPWDPARIKVANIDIEVASEDGFPEPDVANQPIIAITVKDDDKYVVFATTKYGEYIPHRDDIVYRGFTAEYDLLDAFLSYWQDADFDVLTGWSVRFFDVPYIVNRIKQVMGVEAVKRLSPWKNVYAKDVTEYGQRKVAYDIAGIATLDYLRLYRNYTYSASESYRLDHIAHVELDERKISYTEYSSMKEFYKTDWQKFVEYNVKDVELVDKLDAKMGLLDLIFTMAYDAKVNYEDVFSQVRLWDSIIYHHLRKQNIVVPPKQDVEKNEAYAGAFVKDPQLGFHEWIVSFDLASLYPSLIRKYAISPENLVSAEDVPAELRGLLGANHVDALLDKSIDLSALKIHNLAMSANGQFFRRDRQGFLGELMKQFYDERVLFKKKKLETEQKLELVNTEITRRKLS